eukprot:jgi/Psemu1/33962/gm1.33962_g
MPTLPPMDKIGQKGTNTTSGTQPAQDSAATFVTQVQIKTNNISSTNSFLGLDNCQAIDDDYCAFSSIKSIYPLLMQRSTTYVTTPPCTMMKHSQQFSILTGNLKAPPKSHHPSI